MIRDFALFQSPEFIAICETYQVKELYAFGSIARGADTEASDVDLLVEVDENDPIKRGKLLLNLYNAFQTYFNKKVDLLTRDSMKNPAFKKAIDESKVMVYSRD